MLIRWPGVIEPGTVVNEICAHEDLLTTFLAASGEPDIAEKCLKGHEAGDKKFKVRLDGYNLLPALKGEAEEWPRKEFLYWSDDGDMLALRYQEWKVVFREQRAVGFGVWTEPFVELRAPASTATGGPVREREVRRSSTSSGWSPRSRSAPTRTSNSG